MPEDRAELFARADDAQSARFGASKFLPPSLPHIYAPRPRVDAALDAAAAASVTVVCAPAGAGKSVLLSAFAARHPGRDGWVTLDTGDNDATTFWGSISRGAEMMGGTDTDVDGDPRYLLLDDAQVLDARGARLCLGPLVDALPPSTRLLLATRSVSGLPLHRVRVERETAEIHRRELRFTISEAIELFANVTRAGVDIPALVDHTEGWATGLVLEATARGSAEEVESQTREFLFEEVFAKQSDATQRFLMETACFDYLSAGLCDHISGRHDGADVLRRLERDNVFIAPVEHEHGQYVYHRLFRAMLRDELRARDPARADAIHVESARWHEERGHIAEAMEQWLAAGREHEALLLLRSANLDFGDTRQRRLRSWIDRIETPSAHADAEILLDLAASCAMARDHDRLRDILDRVDGLVRATPDPVSELRAGLLRVRIDLDVGDLASHATRLERARDLLHAKPELGHHPLLTGAIPRARRVHPWLGLGYALLERFDEARSALRDRPYESIEDHVDRLFVLGVDATVSFGEGFLDDALALAVRSSRAAEELNIEDILVWPSWLVIAAMMYERDQLGGALMTLEELAQASAEPRGNVFSIAALVELTAVLRARGNASEALERLSRARRDDLPRSGTAARGWVDRATALTLLQLGETRAARAMLGEGAPAEGHRLVGALIELADGEPDRAVAIVASARRDTPRRQLEVTLIAARAAALRGDDTAALLNADRALRIGQQHGFVRTLVDRAGDLMPTFTAAATGPSRAGFVAQLRRAAGHTPAELDRHAVGGPGSAQLSARELEVLRYLPTQLSMREIAGALYVSPNTVKTHLRSVYRKLGVDSRETAIARARVLQLLL